jgi:membrane protease YdiL (CAAX protease family)
MLAKPSFIIFTKSSFWRKALDVPAQLILFSIPSLIYFTIQTRRGEKWRSVLKNLGLNGCNRAFYLEGVGVTVAVGGLMLLALRMVPSSVLESPMVSVSVYAGWPLSLSSFMYALLREAFYVTLGEEILFRGLLGGYLERRFGFMKGNTVQAFIFLLPHLLLLLVSLSFWAVVVVQFLAGWVMGWLRSRSGSILPSWLTHSLMNVLGALSTMG